MSKISVEVVASHELDDVSAFYHSVGYGGGVADADTTIVAKLNHRLVGVVRLCSEGGVIVLRGMQVTAECQRQRIGSALLVHCIPFLDRGTAYCLPYEHLVSFYSQGGFIPATPDMLPAFLADRLNGYVASGQRTIAMRRSTGPFIE